MASYKHKDKSNCSWKVPAPIWGASHLRACSARLEEQDSDLTQVEVDEVLGLVGDVGAEVAAHDAVPGGVVLLVKLLLDEGSDVLLNVEALKGLGRDVDGVLLHVLGHVSVLDDSLAIGHGCWSGYLRMESESGSGVVKGVFDEIYCDSIYQL